MPLLILHPNSLNTLHFFINMTPHYWLLSYFGRDVHSASRYSITPIREEDETVHQDASPTELNGNQSAADAGTDIKVFRNHF